MTTPAAYDAPEYLVRHTERLSQNLSRVDSLLNLYDFTSDLVEKHLKRRAAGPGGPPAVGDILRSATVLLHACLEDFLRTIAQAHIPRTPSDLLKNVPLGGTSNINQPKFTLSDLALHCGKDVSAVIDESIDQWLHRYTFNNPEDIASLLKHIGIDPAKCNGEFSAIAEMIKRRHAIVHNADRPRGAGAQTTEEVSTIDRHSVQAWRDAIQKFMQAVLHELQFVPGVTAPA